MSEHSGHDGKHSKKRAALSSEESQSSPKKKAYSSPNGGSSTPSTSTNPGTAIGEEDPTLTTTLANLPPEVFQCIISFAGSYTELSKLRLVNREFNHTCQQLLTKGFTDLQATVQARLQAIKAQMPRRESSRRKHPLARECDIMETLHMRLVLMQMTFGKHIERNHCCFFAGEILDEITQIIKYTRTAPILGRVYKVTDELFDLSTMAMEYFKERIEPGLPQINFAADWTVPVSNPICYNTLGPRPLMRSGGLPTPVLPRSISTDPSVSQGSSVGSGAAAGEFSGIVRRRSSGCRRVLRAVRRVGTDVATVQRELRSCRARVAHQRRQLVDYTARLEQHERRFDEQSKKLDAVVEQLTACREALEQARVALDQVQLAAGAGPGKGGGGGSEAK